MIIANHNRGALNLPLYRFDNGKKQLLKLIEIPYGRTKDIPDAEWDQIKKSKAIQAYLKKGILTELKTATEESDSPVMDEPTASLPIPEDLLRPEEVDGDMVKVTRKRTSRNTIRI